MFLVANASNMPFHSQSGSSTSLSLLTLGSTLCGFSNSSFAVGIARFADVRSESTLLTGSSAVLIAGSRIVTCREGLGGGGGGVPLPVAAVISSGGGSIPEWSKRSSGAEEGLILLPMGQTFCQVPQLSQSSDGGTTDEDAEDEDGLAWLPPEGVKFPQLGPFWFLPRLSDAQVEAEERAAESLL